MAARWVLLDFFVTVFVSSFFCVSSPIRPSLPSPFPFLRFASIYSFFLDYEGRGVRGRRAAEGRGGAGTLLGRVGQDSAAHGLSAGSCWCFVLVMALALACRKSRARGSRTHGGPPVTAGACVAVRGQAMLPPCVLASCLAGVLTQGKKEPRLSSSRYPPPSPPPRPRLFPGLLVAVSTRLFSSVD